MVKEDFSLKKDVLQIQKKMADLELSATELKETLTKFDTAVLDDIKQRVEDVEDLTMVENAAVIELKNMLEANAPKTEQPQETATIPPQLEERLNSLEQKVSSITVPNIEEIKSSITSSLPVAPAVDTTKLDDAINEIKGNLEGLRTDLENKIISVQQKVLSIEGTALPNIDMLKGDVKNYVLSSLPDNEWIKNELHSFRSYLDAEKVKLDSLMQKIEQDMQTPLPEKAVEELKKIRNEWLMNNAKVEAVEKFVENFSNEINQLKPIIKKLETFEKLMDLQTEITEKLEAFKEYRDHVEKAMTKNEEIERRIQREVDKMKNTEKMFSRIDQSLSVLSQKMEKNKRELDEVVRPLEDRIESTAKNVKDFQDMGMSLDKKLDSVEKNIATVQDDMSVFQGNLMALEQGRSDMTASIANLQETVFKKQPKNEVVELAKRIDSLDAELQGIKSLKPEDTTNELVSKINELEGKIEIVRVSTPFDEHMSEIVSRLVFLESRLVAMEGMIQDTRYAPIVVE